VDVDHRLASLAAGSELNDWQGAADTTVTMPVMRDDSPLAVIWRRRLIIVVTFLAFAVTAAVVSKNLDKVYSTHATLLVALEADEQTFDSVQASQAFARSFADIIDSPNIAARVAQSLGDERDRNQLLDSTTFDPVSETQLLEIHAEDDTPEGAKEIADTYSEVFLAYAAESLTPTTKATVSLADPAPLPRSAARPKPTLYTLLASIVGLAVALALGFLWDRLDRRLRTADDVEARFDRPVLGRIPRRGRSERSVNAFREAFRVLRTNLQFATSHGMARSVAITSGQAEEGKTTAASELAIACAEVGMTVIAIEADFRRPKLQRALLPEVQEPIRPGLSNYLLEASSIHEVLHPTLHAGLSIVPAGPLPPAPAALLESRRGQGGLSSFQALADIVIVDCPPLGIGADASVIATWVEAVLVLVNLGTVTDNAVRDALRQLETVRAPVLGLLLNRDPGVETTSYYYYEAAQESERDRVTARS
jgi:polysaccharide biosynthesis transport protein